MFRYTLKLTRIENGTEWVYHTRFKYLREAYRKAREWDIFYRRDFIIKKDHHSEPYKVYKEDHVRIWSACIIKI